MNKNRLKASCAVAMFHVLCDKWWQLRCIIMLKIKEEITIVTMSLGEYAKISKILYSVQEIITNKNSATITVEDINKMRPLILNACAKIIKLGYITPIRGIEPVICERRNELASLFAYHKNELTRKANKFGKTE